MAYLYAKSEDGALVLFAPATEDFVATDGADGASVIEPLSSYVISADSGEVNWLYEVCFLDSSCLYVLAFNWSDAVITSLLHRGDNTPPRLVLEYDLYELRECGASAPVTYEIGGTALDVLPVVNYRNADLASLALSYSNGRTYEELRLSELDRLQRTLGTSEIALMLDAKSLHTASPHIFNSYILIESTDASLDVCRRLRLAGESADATEVLFYTYIFEQWGHYDCHLAYSLVRGLLDNSFDGVIDDFLKIRDIFK